MATAIVDPPPPSSLPIRGTNGLTMANVIGMERTLRSWCTLINHKLVKAQEVAIISDDAPPQPEWIEIDLAGVAMEYAQYGARMPNSGVIARLLVLYGQYGCNVVETADDPPRLLFLGWPHDASKLVPAPPPPLSVGSQGAPRLLATQSMPPIAAHEIERARTPTLASQDDEEPAAGTADIVIASIAQPCCHAGCKGEPGIYPIKTGMSIGEYFCERHRCKECKDGVPRKIRNFYRTTCSSCALAKTLAKHVTTLPLPPPTTFSRRPCSYKRCFFGEGIHPVFANGYETSPVRAYCCEDHRCKECKDGRVRIVKYSSKMCAACGAQRRTKKRALEEREEDDEEEYREPKRPRLEEGGEEEE